MIDIITVYYDDNSERQAKELSASLARLQALGPRMACNFIAIDNKSENRGFSKACNLGARMLGELDGHGDIIGFLNPDVVIDGPFIEQVERTFAEDETVMITGERFGKPDYIVQTWRVHDWVCGAAFFVRRKWFEELGGFDEQYVWSWEETDFIRRTQEAGLKTKSIRLPMRHVQTSDSLDVLAYKHFYLAQGYYIYMDRWMR